MYGSPLYKPGALLVSSAVACAMFARMDMIPAANCAAPAMPAVTPFAGFAADADVSELKALSFKQI